MQSDKILITGKSGTGKTTYLIRYLLAVPYDFVWAFDHQSELSELLKVENAVTTQDIEEQTWQGFCLFDPAILFPGEMHAGFDFYSDYVFQFSQRSPGKKLFVCDEFQLFSQTDSFSWELSRLIENGRRYQIDCLFISQQPNLIHNRVRNQLTEVVCFQQTDWRVLQCLAEWGFDPQEVSTLKVPGYFVINNFRTGKVQRGTVSPHGLSTNQTEQPETEQENPPEPVQELETEHGMEQASEDSL